MQLVKEFDDFLKNNDINLENNFGNKKNPLLSSLEGADGLKTGHTQQSGYGLTGSVKTKDGRRLIMVINGLATNADRASEARKLMGWGLSHFQNIDLLRPDKTIVEVPVWLGEQGKVHAVPAKKLVETYSIDDLVRASSLVTYESPVSAPVKKGIKKIKLYF